MMTDIQTAPQAEGPLKGLRVIEIGMLFAGPLAGTTLADMGADVIKIEHPSGDEVRKLGEKIDGHSLWWSVTSRNKRVVALDMKTPEGRDIVFKLLETADVLIENFRPGRMDEWGMDYASLRKINPGLVLAHISGYGQSGLYSKRPGLGTLAEAFSGYAHVTGLEDGPPTLPSYPLADSVAAITAVYSILAAIYARGRNGGIGDEVDISLYEPLLSLTGPMVINYTKTGAIAKRAGNRARWSTPRNTYRTRDDRWIAVSSAADSAAMRLFKAIGREDLTRDPNWQTNPERLKRLEECDILVADWIAARDQKEALEQFEKFDVIAGPVYDVEQLVNDPHVLTRETLVEMVDPKIGKTLVQDVVPRFTNAPGKMQWLGVDQIGQHTADVMRELGYSDEQISKLAHERVLPACMAVADEVE